MPHDPRRETLFVRACRGELTDRVPVWMMRQAGRYLPEYRALKERWTFLDLCKNPELAARATLDAARILDTDAAIIFSDITIPALAMGTELRFDPGPILSPPIRRRDDLARLRPIEPERDLDFVLEAIRRTRAALPSSVSLIGFVGAPFTLAAYLVEGRPSRSWNEVKRLIYGDGEVATAILAYVTDAVVRHAKAQLRAGCDAIQLFDSHAGELAPKELVDFAFEPARHAIASIREEGAPIIYFARGIGAHLEAAAEVGADVLGLDWTVTVTDARRRLGSRCPTLMGNLDPVVLLTDAGEVDRRVRGILDEARGHPFVFNLGHGILPPTPPELARQVVLSVRRWSEDNLS